MISVFWRTLSQSLPSRNNLNLQGDHALNGNWKDFRECHIAPDWLLIYQVRENELLLVLTRTGTHAELLGISYNKSICFAGAFLYAVGA